MSDTYVPYSRELCRCIILFAQDLEMRMESLASDDELLANAIQQIMQQPLQDKGLVENSLNFKFWETVMLPRLDKGNVTAHPDYEPYIQAAARQHLVLAAAYVPFATKEDLLDALPARHLSPTVRAEIERRDELVLLQELIKLAYPEDAQKPLTGRMLDAKTFKL